MPGLSPERIREIIDRVEGRLDEVTASPRPAEAARVHAEEEGLEPLGDGIHRTIPDAVAAARRAQALS